MFDALGNLARFVLLPGQRHDSIGVEPLLDGVEVGALIGDRGFDNDWLRRELDERGVLAVIPPKANRKRDIPCDFAMYVASSRRKLLLRHQELPKVATRYDKTDQSFAAMINLVALRLAVR